MRSRKYLESSVRSLGRIKGTFRSPTRLARRCECRADFQSEYGSGLRFQSGERCNNLSWRCLTLPKQMQTLVHWS